MVDLSEAFERAKSEEWCAEMKALIQQKPLSKCISCCFEDCRCNKEPRAVEPWHIGGCL